MRTLIILIGSTGLSLASVRASSIFLTTSIPDDTLPKTGWAESVDASAVDMCVGVCVCACVYNYIGTVHADTHICTLVPMTRCAGDKAPCPIYSGSGDALAARSFKTVGASPVGAHPIGGACMSRIVSYLFSERTEPIEEGVVHRVDEELRSARVGARISHAECARLIRNFMRVLVRNRARPVAQLLALSGHLVRRLGVRAARAAPVTCSESGTW